MGARILVIDNYDSFVYNLVQYLGELGAEPVVHRDDAITLADVEPIDPDGILISPGPGHPSDAGLSNELIRTWGGRRPVFGVCLGLQCIGQVFGGRVVRAPQVMHGKTSLIPHHGVGVFEGLPDPLEATRYHSLIVGAGLAAGLARDHRGDRRRPHHGPASPRADGRGRAVPPGVGPHLGRARPGGQLPAQLRHARPVLTP